MRIGKRDRNFLKQSIRDLIRSIDWTELSNIYSISSVRYICGVNFDS
jgi:hypothetical protein